MRIKFLSIVAFLLSFFYSNATMVKEKYVVINPEGAKIYDQPKFDSKVVAYVNFGDVVIENKTSSGTDIFYAANGITLEGKWMLVNVKDSQGFTFSVHYSNKLSIASIDSEDRPSLNLLGDFIRSTTDTVTIEMTKSDKIFETEQVTKWYENGKLIEIEGDGCYNYEYTYIKASLNEVYYTQVLNEFFKSSDGQIISPVANKQSEGRIEFGDLEATKDLIIQSIGPDKYVVSYYSCD